jgi:hypothetical protein
MEGAQGDAVPRRSGAFGEAEPEVVVVQAPPRGAARHPRVAQEGLSQPDSCREWEPWQGFALLWPVVAHEPALFMPAILTT